MLFMRALSIKSLMKLVSRMSGWFLCLFVTFTIAHANVNVCAIDVSFVISQRNSQTVCTNLQ